MDFYIILLAIILVLIFLSYHVVFYFRTKVPIIITPKKFIINLVDHIKQNNLLDSNSVVYELGSGWGDFSFAIENLNPQKIIAYELSFIHIFWSKIKAKIRKSKISFEMKDFFQADLSDADFIYIFLVPKIVDKVWKKMKQECKTDTMMVLLGHELSNEKYLYKIKTNPDKKDSTYYYFYRIDK
ncbi:hypothetical protein C0580_05045 [Candidatus Parcubacteria bacterium]|nr:MAG: hypothetical protein C0580_05045 [Candidatus Parcubacteria bacterium]